MSGLPERARVYRNHHLDSTRWDTFRPRGGDIVIASSYKSGTTWTQAIVAHLLFQGKEFPAPVWRMSPWLDRRVIPLDQMLADLEAQRHRRFIKTHLALDGLPYFPEFRYIFVGRDGRDVAMSLWNHYCNYSETSFREYNDTPGRVGPELPPPPAGLDAFWRGWCTRGWFDWEQDGWPFWSHFSTTQAWWRYRHLPNMLLVHYADLKQDPSGSIMRIAEFLEIDLEPERVEPIIEATSFTAMRQRGADYVPGGGARFKNGPAGFLHKGTNRQWEGTISPEDLDLYDTAAKRALTDECRRWLEQGGTV
ncbi:MAG: sulfotransferase domain-containing protein [Pseudomonadota bacterium]